MSGRHRPSSLFRSRAVRTPVVVIGVLTLMGLGTVAWRAVSADADGCSSSGIRLTVAADPAIAPAISEIGAAWTATRPSVGDDCVRVDVISKASHEVALELGTWAGGHVDVAAKPVPTPADADLPVVWIPESSYWLGRVRAVDREMFDGVANSVASSPVVLAIPETVARGLDKDLSQGIDAAMISKLALDPKGSLLKLGLVEPRRDTAGMVGAMVLSDAVVASEKDLPKLVMIYRSLATQINDTTALWQAIGDGTKAINGAPVSEQAVLAYNAGGKVPPMAAVPLADVPTLDFPYAARARQPRPMAAAAAAFRTALTSGQYKSVLAQHRLRSPDGTASAGFPTGHGVTTAAVHVQPLNDMAKAKSALTVWVAARTPSRIVAMVDATSSMALTVNGSGKSRMQVMQDAASTGLTLFTPESQVGLWAFAGAGHKNMVPLEAVGPAGSAQRTKLTSTLSAASPMPTDVNPLYQSIKAGYQELLTGYNYEMRNTLVVFTDGGDTTGLDVRQVQRELEILADVTRPIRVVLLGIGPDVKLAELESIAKTTGGAAFQVNSPEEMQLIFLKALLT